MPIVGHYGVNDEGSGDKYYKGGNMLHTIRQIVDRRREVARHPARRAEDVPPPNDHGPAARGLYRQESGIDLSKVFDEYLRTTMIPVFEYKSDGTTLSYHWANVVPGFEMPVRVALGGRRLFAHHTTEAWQTTKFPTPTPRFASMKTSMST